MIQSRYILDTKYIKDKERRYKMNGQIMNKKESDITTDFVLKVKMLKQEDKRIILALLTGMELQSSLDKIEKNNKTGGKYYD